MGWEDVPPEVPAWTETISYQPACAKCRDAAGKDRAGVLDKHLCGPHLIEDRQLLTLKCLRLETRITKFVKEVENMSFKLLALEEENDKLSELFDAAGQDNNILHERIKRLETKLEHAREMYKRDAARRANLKSDFNFGHTFRRGGATAGGGLKVEAARRAGFKPAVG